MEENLEDAELGEALRRGDLETIKREQDEEESKRREIDRAAQVPSAWSNTFGGAPPSGGGASRN
jgi:hypothetical protein